MSKYTAHIRWERTSSDFSYDSYNREHFWTFEGGTRVAASAAPAFLGKLDFVDPEEALVAALSSCHMLTFLALCAKQQITVDSYSDNASGYLEKNAEGLLAITRVKLQPVCEFSGDAPDRQTLDTLHHQAHKQCFIANSVHTKIDVNF